MSSTDRDATISLQDLSKSFGQTVVVPSLTAQFRAGEFTVILGPSGCGKTTLLNMIAGLEPVSGGKIFIGEREIQDEEPKNRGIAMVFQNYSLYPHMTVSGNIGYALKVAGVAKPERADRIAKAAQMVGLEALLDRKPSELSGGQRQRVAIARAIIREPDVLLFDEPLSNLDAKLRHDMRVELANLHHRIGSTSIFVTHDQVEAMTLADRIMILNNGQIEQFASPDDIYHRPATVFVAGFIGAPPMNLLPVTGDGTALHLADGMAIVPSKAEGDLTLGIRPEAIRVSAEGPLKLQVTYVEKLGSHSVVSGTLSDGTTLRLSMSEDTVVRIGERLPVALPEGDCHLFDPQTGKIRHHAPSRQKRESTQS